MSIKKWIRRLASLKLAVIEIIAMGTLIAWGTFVEAFYNDPKMAQDLVYHTWFSYSIFAVFSINLLAVIIDRYPWKKHHISFIAAHVGILTLLGGSLLTRYYGVDGSMSIGIGEQQNMITVPETELLVYTSLGGDRFTKIYGESVNFIKNPPTEKKPYIIPLPAGDVQVTEYYPFSLYDFKVVPSDNENDGPAVRFQFSSERATQTEWLFSKKNASGESSEVRMGPARVVLARQEFHYTSGNVLVFQPLNDSTLKYSVYSDKKKGLLKQGEVKPGDKFDVGWMDFQLRLLKYIPRAHEQVYFRKVDKASEKTVSAFKFVFNGKESWMGANSSLRLYGNSEMYVLSFGNSRIPVDFRCVDFDHLKSNLNSVGGALDFVTGSLLKVFMDYRCMPKNFSIQLKDFQVGRYQGTMQAASYKSLVRLPTENREVEISMNEPLEFNGLTFYQASFKEDERGNPTHSIFSVNYDPGRWIKYLGSLLIVFGSVHLFYRRWKTARSKNA